MTTTRIDRAEKNAQTVDRINKRFIDQAITDDKARTNAILNESANNYKLTPAYKLGKRREELEQKKLTLLSIICEAVTEIVCDSLPIDADKKDAFIEENKEAIQSRLQIILENEIIPLKAFTANERSSTKSFVINLLDGSEDVQIFHEQLVNIIKPNVEGSVKTELRRIEKLMATDHKLKIMNESLEGDEKLKHFKMFNTITRNSAHMRPAGTWGKFVSENTFKFLNENRDVKELTEEQSDAIQGKSLIQTTILQTFTTLGVMNESNLKLVMDKIR
jgi:hypothetical protein